MQSTLMVAALSMTILPLVVPVVAAMPTTANSAEAQEVSSIVVSAVGLSRFGGPPGTYNNAPKVAFGTPLAQFPPVGAAMEIPFFLQLLTVSALLGTFAAAASDDEDKEEDDDMKKNVELVRAPAIAARLAVAAGLFGAHGGFRALSTCVQNTGLFSSEMFPSNQANLEVPIWGQLLIASMLLGVFAAAVSDDDSDKDKDAKQGVLLVRVPAIAARFAVAAALFAAPGAARVAAATLGSSANFATAAVSTEVPVCLQFAVASLLLGVFAIAVADDVPEEKNSKVVDLIRVHAIAARLAVAAGCFAVHSAWKHLEVSISAVHLPFGLMTSSASFATPEITTVTPQWAQLMVVAVLLGVFAALASDDDTEDKESQKAVELIRVPAIAARSAVAAALFAAPGAARAAAATFGSSANFATHQLTLETPVYAQLAVVSVLLGVFALAASEEEEKDSAKVVKLVRVPAIAGRLAITAGCFAVHAAMAPSVPGLSFSGLQQLSTFGKSLSSPANFPGGEATLSVGIPVWAQLLVASGLVAVFAAAISEDESSRKENNVELVRVPAIATRIAAALALFGAPGACRAASAMFDRSESLPISELNTEVPVWAQLAVVSLLLSVFAAAVSEDEATDEQDIESGVKLVRVPSIARRLAVTSGCFAIHAAFVPSVPAVSFAGIKNLFESAKAAYAWIPMVSSPVFASLETSVETPVWSQLLVVSGLLFVFAFLLWTESTNEGNSKVSKKQVQLVRPHAIAARLGAAAALFAIREVMPPLDSTALPGDVLAKGGLLVAGTAFALSGEIQKSMSAKKVA